MNNKLIGTLLLAIMLLSPFAFADDVRLVKVSDLKPGDVILDVDGNEFVIGEVENYDDGSVGVRGTELRVGITGEAVGGLGSVTGMVGAPVGAEKIVGETTWIKFEDGWTYLGNIEPPLTDFEIGWSSSSSNIVGELAIADTLTLSKPTITLNSQGRLITSNFDYINTESLAKYPPTGRIGTVMVADKEHVLSNGKWVPKDEITKVIADKAAADQLATDKAYTTMSNTPVEGTSALSEAVLPKSWTTSTETWGGLGANALLSGIQWAALAYVAGQMIGPMLGLSKDNTKALSTAMAAGFGSYKVMSIYQAAFVKEAELAAIKAGTTAVPQTGFLSYSGLWGLGIAVVIFVYMYKTTDTEVVTFNCMPWQAPVGGDVCEECNDAELPCSEYRCKSLGQNCDIVNSGTADEKCVNINPRDVNPPTIRPNYNVLSKGHEYTNVKHSPPGPGFKIVNMDAGDGCLKAFTPLEFGISVDEPAQCKIDFNHTETFDEMVAYIGGNNLYSYNHSERLSLPSVAALKNSSLVLENGKDLTLFIRCKDKNGNENGAEYAVNFCVDPTPDNTAPKVEATSVLDGGCVAENQDKAEVVFYTNEPAECRWSSQDQDYDNMQNAMVCSSEMYQANALQLFGCTTELTGISREDTKFYVRCKDQPGAEENARNENKESFEFSLRGSTGLKMKDLQPNGTVFGAVSPMPIELKVKTLFGCNDGQAICRYSLTGDSRDYIQFFDTNNEDGIHIQRLDLTAGTHEYFVQCIDEGGNLVEDSVTFNLDIDVSAPVVARIYEEDGMLKIVTVRESECSMTFDNCDFSFDEGTVMPYANSTVHVAEWNDKKTYYIKCRDEFRNEDADCSVVVRPSRDFL